MNEDNTTNTEAEHSFSFLLDSKYPLLQEFRDKCPGTFKHSQALSGMVESISIALDLDVDLMKTASTYHDIGKMFNPKFFSENQLEGEDLHKGLQTKMSYEIITRHVSDSVVILLNDSNFPREIIEIISQHHGTTVLQCFFNKSKGKDMIDFRYKTSIPNSVESAVLMIADNIEATSRSLAQAGKLDSVNIIDDTINRLLDDGQLDQVTIRLGDLKKIKTALAKELEGLYQKRIDYSETKEKKE